MTASESRFFRAGLFLICVIYPHVSGWKPCNLHDLPRVSWVAPVLYISCTTSHYGRFGSRYRSCCRLSNRSRSILSVRCVYRNRIRKIFVVLYFPHVDPYPKKDAWHSFLLPLLSCAAFTPPGAAATNHTAKAAVERTPWILPNACAGTKAKLETRAAATATAPHRSILLANVLCRQKIECHR